MALTTTRNKNNPGELESIDLTWVADITADGGSSSDVVAGIRGTIEGVVFIPSLVSGEEPTAAYDVTLDNAIGVDVLGGKGANLSATVPSSANTNPASTPVFPIPTVGLLTLNVINASLGASGIVRLLFRK